MGGRLFDVAAAAVGLVVSAPLWLVAYVGIRSTSPGPVLFRARRVGRGGREFILYKFRTMAADSGSGGPITAAHDARVFPFGRWLRASKVDELPQLLNVLKGDMAIVGPRPEHPDIVEKYYTDADRETLSVLPGLASPGSLYNYTHVENTLIGDDVAVVYATRILPVKLGLDRIYVRHASLTYDLRIICRTIYVVAGRMLGRRRFPQPPEMSRSGELALEHDIASDSS